MSKEFSKNLARIRKEKGLTQEKLAEKTGLKRAVIGSYEENRSEPSYTNLLKIRDALQTTLNELLQ